MKSIIYKEATIDKYGKVLNPSYSYFYLLYQSKEQYSPLFVIIYATKQIRDVFSENWYHSSVDFSEL